MKYQKPTGTRDFYPEDMEPRNVVFNSLRNTALNYGFGEIEAPAFESLDLLKAKSGEEITSQIFNLEKKGNEEFGLRPDITISCARMFVEKQKSIPKPVKWFYLTRMWRYERPQKGRLREFYQFGVELFGSLNPEADAEIISLAIDSLVNLGLTKEDIVIKINNRLILNGLLMGLKINDKEAVIRLMDKIKKISEQEFEKELKDLNLTKDQISKIKQITKIKKTDDVEKLSFVNDEVIEGLDEVKAVLSYLEKYNKKEFVEFDITVARGLAYYTGTVFECMDKKGELRSIFGGGRYDNLIEKFGGNPEPATGFAIGDVTLQLLLEKKGLWPKKQKSVDYYITIVDDSVKDRAIEIAQALRTSGKTIRVDIDLMQRKVRKQFEYASKINAVNAIVIGEKEIKSGKLTIRNMKSGKEDKVELKKLIS